MNLSLTVSPDFIPSFFQFLQCGIQTKAHVGCSIRSFLLDQLRLTPEFIQTRIMTIFLDGKPIDNMDSAILKDGCTLALSGAMPGLVGATMRMGSYYASFRSEISHREEESAAIAEGSIVLKLFNIVARELGPTLLERGICVKKKELEDFFKSYSTQYMQKCRQASLDGESINTHGPLEMGLLDQPTLIQLQVKEGDL